MNLEIFSRRTKEIQTVNFAILLGQEDEGSRRRCSVDRGYIPEERDPPWLRDRVGHGCGVLLEQALSWGSFIYGRDLCATEIKLNMLTVPLWLITQHRNDGETTPFLSILAVKLLPYPSTSPTRDASAVRSDYSAAVLLS